MNLFKKGAPSSEESRAATGLIFLCWLVYTCSYVGKVNYAANINGVMEYFSVDHAEAGFVGTAFFFAYGAGQVFNAFMCKKYNVKLMVFVSMITSGTVNLAVGLCPDFEIIKYLWIINGFSLSILWPSLIRLLSETVSAKNMSKATVAMGTTVAIGTLFIYGLSSVYATFTDFRMAFFTAAAILIGVGFIWIFSVTPAINGASRTNTDKDEVILSRQERKKTGILPTVALSCILLAFYGIATNLIKDGLITWVPSILKESFGTGDSLSIVLTLALPIVSVFGNVLAVNTHKRIKDFVLMCSLFFAVAGAILGAVTYGFSKSAIIPSLVGFAAVCFLVSACNSVITSIFPLFMKSKLNSGFIAGILNGFCYVGSTLSSYGLGRIADERGWSAVLWVLLSVCAATAIAAGIYTVLRTILRKKEA